MTTETPVRPRSGASPLIAATQKTRIAKTQETSRSTACQTTTTAEYLYDYAGQDPINGYDLDGLRKRPGNYTPKQKQQAQGASGGKCATCGKTPTPGVKLGPGDKIDPNRGEVHHPVPGDNTVPGVFLCRTCHMEGEHGQSLSFSTGLGGSSGGIAGGGYTIGPSLGGIAGGGYTIGPRLGGIAGGGYTIGPSFGGIAGGGYTIGPSFGGMAGGGYTIGSPFVGLLA